MQTRNQTPEQHCRRHFTRAADGQEQADHDSRGSGQQACAKQDSAQSSMDRIVAAAEPIGELEGSADHVEHARTDVQVGQPRVSYEARIIQASLASQLSETARFPLAGRKDWCLPG
jgi:hypothetical protein